MRYKVRTKLDLSHKFGGVEDIFRALYVSELATQIAMEYLSAEDIICDQIVTGDSHTTVISFYAHLEQRHVDVLTFMGFDVCVNDPTVA